MLGEFRLACLQSILPLGPYLCAAWHVAGVLDARLCKRFAVLLAACFFSTCTHEFSVQQLDIKMEPTSSSSVHEQSAATSSTPSA